MWLATAGDDVTEPPVVAVHNGEHTFGEPAQFAVPAASNAYSFLSADPTNTTPSATAADDVTESPVVAVHNGEHTFGEPAQFAVPAALNA
jgi:hypothetical protein